MLYLRRISKSATMPVLLTRLTPSPQQVQKQIALEHVAHLTDIDLAEVAFLNPQYKLGIIPVVKNQTYTLRLPIDKVGVFVSNQDTIWS